MLQSNSKTRKRTPDFSELFLKENRLSDRRMIYIGKEAYEELINYVSVISDRKLSMAGYLDNIVSHHIEEHRDTIKELFDHKVKLFSQQKWKRF